jgi:hypothetical protein
MHLHWRRKLKKQTNKTKLTNKNKQAYVLPLAQVTNDCKPD